MKIMIVLLLTVCISSFAVCQSLPQGKHHNKIDDVKTAEDIHHILMSINPRDSAFRVGYPVSSYSESREDCKHIIDSLNIKPWTKADLDGNGYTDVLVLGMWYSNFSAICILDDSSDHFRIETLTSGFFQHCIYPLISVIDGHCAIINYSYNDRRLRNSIPPRLQIDTLVIKNGSIAELNACPVVHEISRIEYSASGCYGTCPVFDLILDKKGNASYNAKMYNKREGQFDGKISADQFKEIEDWLNYIAFAHLDSNYSVPWTDDQSATLTITYEHNQVKHISDYGMIGTFGLRRLYKMLYNFRERTWEQFQAVEKEFIPTPHPTLEFQTR